MLCQTCTDSIEGIWDPCLTPRIALLDEFKDQCTIDKEEEWPEKCSELPHLYGHHKTEESFLQSRNDCALCICWLEKAGILHRPELTNLGFYSAFFVTFSDEFGEKTLILHFEHVYGFEEVCLWRIGTCSEIEQARSINQLGWARNVSPDTSFLPKPLDGKIQYALPSSANDPKSWETVDYWMKNCLGSHPKCRNDELRSYRPTRLLQLRPKETNTFRMIPGEQCPPLMKYAALSYCWGHQPSDTLLMLSSHNYEWLIKDQPVKVLPATFRDAINVCQHFGVEYLWIDRLCIVQDSRVDWQDEASKMKNVYENAFFSIAALGAHDSDGGLFFNRNPNRMSPRILRLPECKDGELVGYRVHDEYTYQTLREFGDEPLIQRSWVFQERLLAPRTIYYGTHQLVWECHEVCTSELKPESNYWLGAHTNGPDIDPDSTKGQDEQLLNKKLFDSHAAIAVDHPYQQLLTDWTYIVEQYAPLNLTMPSDKLVAISGIADDTEQALSKLRPAKHRYLYGLWEEDLSATLCWRVYGGDGSRALQYRAPSWSWACIDGEVFFPVHARHVASVVFASIHPVEDEESSLWNASLPGAAMLSIAAPFARVDIDVSESGIARISQVSAGSKIVFRRPDESEWLDWRVFFDTDSDGTDSAYLVAIFAAPWSEGTWRGVGLLLREDGSNHHHRVGVANFDFQMREEVDNFVKNLEHREIIVD